MAQNPMNPRARIAFVAAALAVAGGVGFAVTRGGARPPVAAAASPSASASGSGKILPAFLPTGICATTPPRASTPSWLAGELPLPDGAFAASFKLPPLVGFRSYQQAMLIAPATLHDYLTFALTAWKQRGWTPGRGDGEPGEVENTFVNQSDGRFAAFKATSALCDHDKIMVWIVVARL